MKLLFHNYSNEVTTEPLYLSNALRQCGVDAALWADPNVSAFDALDMAGPDVFVSHAYAITPDIFKYLTTAKNIDLVLNVTGLTDTQITDLEGHLKRSGVNCPFIFTNHFGFNKKPATELKFHTIYPCADLFNAAPAMGDKTVKEAVLCKESGEQLNDAIRHSDQYHMFHVTNGDLDEAFDMRTNINSLKGLYPVYEKIRLVGDANFCSSQFFFDLNFNTYNIAVTCSDRPNFDKFLAEAFEDKDDGGDIKLQVRNQIKDRHTPWHRAATLCKHLKAKDEMMKVERAKSQLSTMLEDK